MSKKKTPVVETPVERKKANIRYCMLTYDIPSSLDYPNPSYRLRRVAVRVNLSCWIVPTTKVPHDLLDEFEREKINYHVISFDTKEREKIREIAKSALDDETRRLHTSLIKTIADASDRFLAAQKAMEENESADTELGRFNALKDKFTRLKCGLNRAGEGLNAAIECAEIFDERESVEDLMESLRLAIASCQESYNVELAANRSLFPETNGGGVRKNSSILEEATGVRVKIFGYSPSQVLRWMGKEGWTFADARAVMLQHSVDCTESSIKSGLYQGKYRHHTAAKLTEEQGEALREMIGEQVAA